MKNRQMKTRAVLLLSLTVIMSFLVVLYMIFCSGGEYNEAEIEIKNAEITTEPSENSTQSPQSSSPTSPAPTPEGTQTGTSSFPAIDPEAYNPIKMLNSENWAVTLINKNFGLGKNFYPVVAPVSDATDIYIDERIVENYNRMYNAALSGEEKIILIPSSGYQNYSTQKSLYDKKLQAFITNGNTEEEAIKNVEMRINPAGYSENGAGLAIDFAPTNADFASSKEFNWLMTNAYKYGFVLRYPKDKTEITGMIYQPWHWRYVGVAAATEMKEKNLCLEEYLGLV